MYKDTYPVQGLYVEQSSRKGPHSEQLRAWGQKNKINYTSFKDQSQQLERLKCPYMVSI